MKTYKRYRNKMKFGDVLAFSGKGAVSDLIKVRTGSKFSHVGMVYGFYPMVPGQDKSLMMVESTSIVSKRDDVHGELIKGVQMHWLSTRLATFEGQVWWASLKARPTMDQEEAMTQWLHKKHASRTPYDTKQAIGCAIDWWDALLGLENERDFSSLFCSELVARAYQVGGVLGGEVNASEQEPGDVMGYPFLNDPVLIYDSEAL